MKRYKKEILILNRTFIIFFAAFVSLYVTFHQGIQQQWEKNSVETKIPAQEGEDQNPDAEYLFVSSAAITSFFSFGTVAATFFIHSIKIEKDNYVKLLDTSTFYINKYFETLFNRIISPNAP